MEAKLPIGIAGLGLMGGAIAARLLDARFDVLGFDIDPGKFAASGGVQRAGSLRDVADRCRCIVIAVYDTAQVGQVLDELLPAGGGRIYICTTTCDPAKLEAIAARVAQSGSTLVEFPISGTSAQLRSGEAIGMSGGPAEAISGIDGVLAAMCAKRFHVGKAGDAGRAKLAINLVLQVNRAALAEGLVFAERMGLDARSFFEVLRASPARSAVMDAKGDKMLRRDYTPESRIAQTLKDAQLMLAEANRLGQRLPLLEANAALLAAAVGADGERDSAAVIEAVRESRVS